MNYSDIQRMRLATRHMPTHTVEQRQAKKERLAQIDVLAETTPQVIQQRKFQAHVANHRAASRARWAQQADESREAFDRLRRRTADNPRGLETYNEPSYSNGSYHADQGDSMLYKVLEFLIITVVIVGAWYLIVRPAFYGAVKVSKTIGWLNGLLVVGLFLVPFLH